MRAAISMHSEEPAIEWDVSKHTTSGPPEVDEAGNQHALRGTQHALSGNQRQSACTPRHSADRPRYVAAVKAALVTDVPAPPPSPPTHSPKVGARPAAEGRGDGARHGAQPPPTASREHHHLHHLHHHLHHAHGRCASRATWRARQAPTGQCARDPQCGSAHLMREAIRGTQRPSRSNQPT